MERLKHIIQLNVLFGAWLIAAPFILGYASSRLEMGNDVAVGVLLVACSWWMLAAEAGQVGAGSLQLLGGLWLIAAPFVWRYAHLSRPFSNDVILGILSALTAATATWLIASGVRKAA
jgi:hypothetical protein